MNSYAERIFNSLRTAHLEIGDFVLFIQNRLDEIVKTQEKQEYRIKQIERSHKRLIKEIRNGSN